MAIAMSTARAFASSGAAAMTLRSSLTNSAPTSRSISSPELPVPTSSSASWKPWARSRRRLLRTDAIRPEALGDLHDDAAGIEARVGDGAQEPVVVGVEVEGLRRDVEEQQLGGGA